MADTSPLWTGRDIAAAVGGRSEGGDFEVRAVTFDSREVGPGDLFIALHGARDGHDFVAQAFGSGAAGVLVDHPVEGGPFVVAVDTLKGLEVLGAAARDRAVDARRGAVTGSVGKTSVTQAIRAGLDLAGRAHGSVKSYNNHIGVPLSLARMPAATRRAVFEIGMNAPGEIAPLARMVRPHAACVTAVGPVHIEAFADGEVGIAHEKAAIFEGLVEGGVAVFNGDVEFATVLAEAARRAGARLAVFGTEAGADARLIDFAPGAEGAVVRAEIHGRAVELSLRQSGFHWGLNSLCVLLMLEALDVSLETGLAALAEFRPLAGRGQITNVRLPRGGEFTLIDESYNANPLSMAAGFRSLGARSVPPGGRRIVVLTDMLELGDRSRALHEGLAESIDAAGLDCVHVAGPEMRWLWDALPVSRRGFIRDTAAELAEQADMLAAPGDVIMVKGSNGSRAALVARALAELGAV